MKITEPLKKGERIIVFSTLFFVFFLFLYFFREAKFVEPKVEILNTTNIKIEELKLEPNVSMIVNDCRNKNYTNDKVDCMVKYAKKYIEYNLTNPIYDIPDMFIQGTNCVGFANYYSQISNMVNLNHKSVELSYGNKAHRASIVIGDSHYCFVNLWSYKCWSW